MADFCGQMPFGILRPGNPNPNPPNTAAIGKTLARPQIPMAESETSNSATLATKICNQIASVFTTPTTCTTSLTILVNEISSTNGKIFVYGVGREGLMLKAFCMRLFHLGLSSHCVFDMTTPPISSSDLLIASAGPGGFSTVDAICGVAKSAGARVVVVTAQPGSVNCADMLAFLPAQTMADNEDEDCGLMPMGSVYEGALFVLFEMVVFELTRNLGGSADEIRARHTNLE